MLVPMRDLLDKATIEAMVWWHQMLSTNAPPAYV